MTKKEYYEKNTRKIQEEKEKPAENLKSKFISDIDNPFTYDIENLKEAKNSESEVVPHFKDFEEFDKWLSEEEKGIRYSPMPTDKEAKEIFNKEVTKEDKQRIIDIIIKNKDKINR